MNIVRLQYTFLTGKMNVLMKKKSFFENNSVRCNINIFFFGRFAQFFLCPLFTQSATERELNAVNSENDKNLKLDAWRIGMLKQSLGNPMHEYSNFGTGKYNQFSNMHHNKFNNTYLCKISYILCLFINRK